MSDRDDLARLLEQHPAYSTGNDQQDLLKAREAADAILAAGWVHFARQAQLVRAERDTLAATVERVRAICDDPQGHLDERAVRVRYERIRVALAASSDRPARRPDTQQGDGDG